LKAKQITLLSILPFSFPIFLGIVLGFLIARGYWFFALGLAALIPLAILFSTKPFIGVILWLILMPLSSALPNPELMYWVLHRLLIPITLFITFLPRLLRGSGQPKFQLGLPEVCIVILIIYIPISLFFSGSISREPIIKYLDRMLIPFCMYLIIRLSALRSSELNLLQWTVLFIVASQCLIGFVSLFASHLLPYAWRPHLQGYIAGSLVNPNVFACVLGFCLCLLIHTTLDHKSGFVKFIFLLASVVCVVCIFLSMERAAWLALVLVLLGFSWLYPKIIWRFLLVAAVFLIVLGEIFFSKYSSRIIGRISNQGTINDRIVVSDAMIQMIQIKPVFGWGYDTLNNHIENYYRQVGAASASIVFTTSHNTYLTIFTELGLVGFLLYMLPMLWLLVVSFRVWRGLKKVEPAKWLILATFWLAALNIFVISNLMDMRFFPIGLTLWWMNLGLIANILERHGVKTNSFFSNPSLNPLGQNLSKLKMGFEIE